MLAEEALRAAREAGLDLVEVDPNSTPPVCKIMDYGKFRYRQKKRLHHSTHKQHAAQIKAIRLFPKTEEHDLQHKARHAADFLKSGDKVLVFMRFFGRWITHQEIGVEVMRKFAAHLEDVAKVEQEPRMDGRRMSMILAPKPASEQKSAKKAIQKTEKPNAQSQDPQGNSQTIPGHADG